MSSWVVSSGSFTEHTDLITRFQERFAGERVLVTGATGFVGGAVAQRFLATQADVHLTSRRKDLPAFGSHKVTWHQGDLADRVWVNSLMRELSPHVIVHCASYGGFHWETDVSEMVSSNVWATTNLIEAAEQASVRAFVHSGSSSEYGPSETPMHEDMCLRPTTMYGATKAAATLLCCASAKATGLPATVLRLFSPYGPGESDSRLVSSVILDCLEGENPKVSSGNQARDFVFIDDVVDAYFSALTSPLVGEVINVGSGQQSLVRDVVLRIVQLAGNDVRPEWGAREGRVFDTASWQADIAKARHVLNWVPSKTIDEGLKRTIAHHRSRARLDRKK